jgi:hypothetical protein
MNETKGKISCNLYYVVLLAAGKELFVTSSGKTGANPTIMACQELADKLVAAAYKRNPLLPDGSLVVRSQTVELS